MTKQNVSPFHKFIDQVSTQIKSKEAQTMVEKELISHLEDSSKSFQQAGYSREEADKKAVKQMGNPIVLGKELHQLHRPKMDWGLFTLFLLIISLSLIPMYFLSNTFGGLILNKMLFSFVSIIIVTGLLFFDYRKLARFGKEFYITAVSMMIFILLFGGQFQGKPVWDSGIFRVDFLGTLLLFYLAWASIFSNVQVYNTIGKKMILYLLFWLPVLFYVWNGYYIFAVTYFIAVLAMFYNSNTNKRFSLQCTILNAVTACVLSVLFYLTAAEHVRFRLSAYFTFLNPEVQESVDYRISVAKEMVAEAGWFGQGHSSEKIMLPEAHTDMIFPYVVHTFGWLFGLFTFLILLFLVFRMIRTAKKTDDVYGQLLINGGAFLLATPFIWNVAMSIGILPLVSVSLPFVSYGGTQSIFYSTIIGLILSVYRRKDMVSSNINTS